MSQRLTREERIEIVLMSGEILGYRHCRLHPRLIEDCISPLPSSPSKKTSSAKRKQYYINRAIRNSDLIPKAKGRKSLQRLENNRYLLSLLERDECVADEVDSCICSSPSIFAEACNNEVYIEIWNDFMNRPGEEQEKLLMYLDQKVRKPKEKVNKCKDERTEHPAYTPEECYQRINRRLRFTLKRRHVPMIPCKDLSALVHVVTVVCRAHWRSWKRRCSHFSLSAQNLCILL
ncbi:R3H domain-containing protein 4 isoform X4 [Dendrobates tinctorius]|uniref:R3H domain-containing protein 4 isoform X4 n=1 Tax=Dendrobates tinctorius TaxID=92724 RepID=UPI003CC9EE0E